MDEAPKRERIRMDWGWRFHLGDLDTPLANKHIAAYMNNKAGWSRGPARGPYDDSDWRELDLPHDWSVEGSFSPDNHLNAGYLPRGVAWYRRHFALNESDRNKRLTLDFDGVSTFCTVYVNGHLLHRNFCGYTPFTVDFTDVATFGEQLNTVAVKVDATYAEGWWYEGAGIYRHVYLSKRPPIHIDDVQIIATPTDDGGAELIVRTTIVNTTDDEVTVSVGATPASPVRVTAGDAGVAATLRPHSTTVAEQLLRLANIKRWSIESPNLYGLTVELRGMGYQPMSSNHGLVAHATIDQLATRFAVRTIRFDADQGFFLNDDHVLLKGVCIHQDHAGVGVAVPDSIQRFRIQRLKEMGCNAVRPGHHPLAPEVMDACDELGMLVLGENRNFGSSPEHLKQLEAMIRRDRNRPSVFAWCLCNEEPIQTTPIAKNIARTMRDAVRELDTTRPVTVAMSGGILNDDSMADVVDIMGINYQLPQHDAFHDKHPTLPVFLSETHCAYGTRGVSTTDPAQHRFADNDTEHAPWGTTARTVWEHVQARPWIAGYFAWTGFDYRGEPSPHEWPSVVSHWGIMDLCGYPKGAYSLHREWWRGDAGPRLDLPPTLSVEIDPGFDSPIIADGHCAIPIRVMCAGEDHEITFDLTGPARIIGVGNGDPTSHEPDKSNKRRLFNGLAHVIIQTTDEPGEITLTAHGLGTASMMFRSEPSTQINQLPIASPRYVITEWRMSPITSERPDPTVAPDAADMNTWLRVSPGDSACKPFESQSGFAIYRGTAKLPKRFQQSGARLVLRDLSDDAEIYVNDIRRVPGADIVLPPAPTHTIVILAHNTGLRGPAELLPPG